ncbi:MAG TPA: hypothetical protein VF857_09590, partial [Spirochaetota bacterium]
MKHKKRIHTSLLSTGFILRINQPGKGYGTVIIVHILPEFIIVTPEEGFSLTLYQGEEAGFYCWAGESEGSYSWKGRILGLIDSNEQYFVLSHENIADWSPTQNCVNLDDRIPIRFFALHTEGERLVEAENPVFMQGTIVRLSDSEAEIICEPP